MTDKTLSLAEAIACLGELTNLVAAGESVIITKRGKPVVRMSPVARPRQPIDLEAMRTLTASMPTQQEDAATLIRRVREDARL